MKIQIKKLLEEATIPKYQKNGDCGLDLTATSKKIDKEGNWVYGTGIAIKIPEGYFGMLASRSSIAKYDLMLSNSLGIIDSNYTGELMFKFKVIPILVPNNLEEHELLDMYDNSELQLYNVGDRIGQLVIMPYPQIEFEEVKELPTTERNDKGFGSSGN